MQSNIPSRRGFTLVEFAVLICVVTVVAAVLFPIVARPRGCNGRRPTCASNQKQIALAFLQYIQDYDEKFPPVVSYLKVRGTDEKERVEAVSWAVDRQAQDGSLLPGLLQPYVKSSDLFLDPDGPKRKGDLYYMYNDLLASQPQNKLADASQTILTCDGEDLTVNAGHAYEPDLGPFDARTGTDGRVRAGKGATVRQAPFRHDGGANFAFADGHVKQFKSPDNTLSTIYFPPRSTSDSSHTSVPNAPVPGGDMKSYTGTFHLW